FDLELIRRLGQQWQSLGANIGPAVRVKTVRPPRVHSEQARCVAFSGSAQLNRHIIRFARAPNAAIEPIFCEWGCLDRHPAEQPLCLFGKLTGEKWYGDRERVEIFVR